jgi:hypothetical protein
MPVTLIDVAIVTDGRMAQRLRPTATSLIKVGYDDARALRRSARGTALGWRSCAFSLGSHKVVYGFLLSRGAESSRMSGRRVAANSDCFSGVPAMLCHRPAETTLQVRQRVCQQCAEAVETRWRFSPFARAAASSVAQEDYPLGQPGARGRRIQMVFNLLSPLANHWESWNLRQNRASVLVNMSIREQHERRPARLSGWGAVPT